MKLVRIPALVDNYIWLLIHKKKCIIIDPGIAKPVKIFLEHHDIQPIAILLTHHHNDHVNGIKKLKINYPKIDIYGPMETYKKGAKYIIKNGDILIFFGCRLNVFSVPGHTLGHLAYYQKPYLFCGDTLFSGGCGRIFEGNSQQMYRSLNILKKLPDETFICCGHEYTAINMKFASYLLPNDEAIKNYTLIVNQKKTKKEPTIPSTLKLEKKINIFLRSHDYNIKKALGFSPHIYYSNYEIFKKIRKLKDFF
ncbi:MAG: hydroxyacylglutathione hydrolase [Arsenophonus sp.]|nr:MAG: hydroxyacylglutathione hydrolase [Arsenophonus sp.]